MATKKATSLSKALPKRFAELQRSAEKQLRKNIERATEMLPDAPRKALKRFTANAERTRHDLRKRGEKMFADARKRAERVTTEVQKRIEGVVTPLTNRLDVASRSEVERLRKRLHEIERRLDSAPTA
jgi:BMFP domain-containing protein YqiC